MLESLFDKWLYVLQNLSGFQERPQKLQEKVFGQLFEAAEIAKLKPKEMKMYDESLKIYRDNENTMEYAKKMAREEERIELAKMFKRNGASIDLIAKSTGLSREQIEQLDA